ncbi:MAG: cyclic nucleotide-binding domain-containing protein [Bdellovibrionales bacterium]|nr:cyclic nucleotide-binding domain-containing protein [Bdellovibrionales bacterium]
MYTLEKLPSEVEQFARSAKESIRRLFELLPCEGVPCTVSAGRTLFEDESNRGKIFLIQEGTLKLNQGEHLLYLLEEGDLVTTEFSLPSSPSTLYAEFAVRLRSYDASEFFKAVAANEQCFTAWNEYHANLIAWTSGLIKTLTRDEAVFSPSIMIFQQGDIMVQEGEPGDYVFTLMEGKADVVVGGLKVGEILEEEMFGAVSLLTDRPTLASVVAATDCMVVQLSRDEFMNLVQSRPDTIFKLASDLSRAIMSLNDQMLEIKSGIPKQ